MKKQNDRGASLRKASGSGSPSKSSAKKPAGFPSDPSREATRIRQRVALKLLCNEMADETWAASPQEARRYERSREAVGYSDALFAVAEGRVEVPALGIGGKPTKEAVRRTVAQRSLKKPDPKAAPKTNKKNSHA